MRRNTKREPLPSRENEYQLRTLVSIPDVLPARHSLVTVAVYEKMCG